MNLTSSVVVALVVRRWGAARVHVATVRRGAELVLRRRRRAVAAATTTCRCRCNPREGFQPA